MCQLRLRLQTEQHSHASSTDGHVCCHVTCCRERLHVLNQSERDDAKRDTCVSDHTFNREITAFDYVFIVQSVGARRLFCLKGGRVCCY